MSEALSGLSCVCCFSTPALTLWRTSDMSHCLSCSSTLLLYACSFKSLLQQSARVGSSRCK